MRYENGLSTQGLEVGFGDDAINRMSSVSWTRPGVGTGALTLAGYSWLGSMRQQRTNTYGGATTLATGVSDYAASVKTAEGLAKKLVELRDKRQAEINKAAEMVQKAMIKTMNQLRGGI